MVGVTIGDAGFDGIGRDKVLGGEDFLDEKMLGTTVPVVPGGDGEFCMHKDAIQELSCEENLTLERVQEK